MATTHQPAIGTPNRPYTALVSDWHRMAFDTEVNDAIAGLPASAVVHQIQFSTCPDTEGDTRFSALILYSVSCQER